ncbi:MAG: aminotransferase class I/II-fold pyridoxal phosphate-dependent enzyme [Sphingobacteriales bacterium]|nr:MAG: aminotransferase class I/II-fold pyridoxal phosphate-dependent enzyme [Sphingobacteriales bacterium]
MQTANRLNNIGEYYFSQKLREIDTLNKEGKNIISLGIGSPDLPPHPSVIETLKEESAKPSTHAYQSYKGSPILRNAIANWYAKWYQVTLNPDTQILPLLGSKEGIMHICMTYFEHGIGVLIPNPGYPTYASAVKLSGATPLTYNLQESNNYEPDFEQISQTIAAFASENNGAKVKGMFVNYPHMPTGQGASLALFDKLVAFAKQHQILLIHDNPYSFILNDKPMSLLSANGAFDVAIELNSLSKSHNMAGWRIGMLCGAEERIDEVLRFKSNMDSGMFLPAQLAAAKALELDSTWHTYLNEIYAQRRNKVYELLTLLNCKFSTQQVGLFVWAAIPAIYTSGYQLSDEVLYSSNVFITPGGIFGNAGDNYIRVSLCNTVEKIEEALNRVKQNQHV